MNRFTRGLDMNINRPNSRVGISNGYIPTFPLEITRENKAIFKVFSNYNKLSQEEKAITLIQVEEWIKAEKNIIGIDIEL